MIADEKLNRRFLTENTVIEKENMGNGAGGEIIKEIIQAFVVRISLQKIMVL